MLVWQTASTARYICIGALLLLLCKFGNVIPVSLPAASISLYSLV
jgi:hypothetical protein